MPTPANQVEALECPLRNHWVSFRLVDEHGQGLPYAGLAYRLQIRKARVIQEPWIETAMPESSISVAAFRC